MTYRNLCAAAALTATASMAAAPTFPESIQEANILHCFDWTFAQIIEELPAIAEAGFGAVQVSPVQGNCATNAEWYYAYLPYDFAFRANGNGTKAKLKQLCEEADTYGIKVIVDVVANHINPANGYRAAWWNEEGRLRTGSAGVNYNDRYSITHHNLGNYQDVNSENPEVAERAVAFVTELRDLGVKGIRWDAAKHIGLPSEDCGFWTAVTSVEGLWHYGELLDNPGTDADTGWNVMREYASMMSVTDTGLSGAVTDAFRRGGIPADTEHLTLPSVAGIDPHRVVYWAESHDTYANENGSTKKILQSYINRAYIYLACREGATALYLSRPAEKEYALIKMGQKGSTDCLSLPEIRAVNLFRVAMNGKEDAAYALQGSQGYGVVTRRDGGAVIVMNRKGEYDVEVPNVQGFCRTGTWTDELTGNEFTVTPETISGHVGPTGYVVLMAGEGAGVGNTMATPADNCVRWYTIQGTELTDRPTEPGLYIRRDAGGAHKIII